MGKASSSKKVARAAGIGGGRVHRRQTPWGYYGIIGLIVVLGVVTTVVSRNHRDSVINSQGNTPPMVGQTWHEGYAIYECGKFVPNISIKSPDPQGIATKTDGIITIAPTVKAAAGKNATLGKFADAVGLKLNAAELQTPGGHLYLDGATCDGKAGHVYVRQFNGPTDSVGQLFNGDTKHGQLAKTNPAQVILADNDLLTIAFVPSSDVGKIPPPPQSVVTQIELFQQQEAAASSSSTTPANGTSSPTT